MLLSYNDFLKATNILDKPFKGIVVSNDDPKRVGRVKCKIEGLLEDIDNLIWIYPKNPAGLGGGKGSSSFAVPEVGSELIIEFPFREIYMPYYTGYWQSLDTHQTSFNQNYPNSYGFMDSAGNEMRTDKTSQETVYSHSSGTEVAINKAGLVSIRSKKGVKFLSEDEKTEYLFDLETGSVKLSPKDAFDIGSATLNLKPKQLNIESSEINEVSLGSMKTAVAGGKSTAVGGCDSLAILSNKAVSVGGSESECVAQKSEKVIGLGEDRTIVSGGRATNIVQGNDELSVISGNYKVSVAAGNVEIETLAGSAAIGNAIAKLEVSSSGDVKISNATGQVEVSAAGAISVKNNMGKVEISPSGAILIDGKTTLEAKGLTQSTFGSGAGMTEIKGTMVNIGGGGPGVARLGDQCIGVGNMGSPVMSTIIQGSFKVFAG